MTVGEACGHHCGSANGREGHCDCPECHAGGGPVVITRSDLTAGLAGVPMCEKWAARARRWDEDHPAGRPAASKPGGAEAWAP
jgi:hypothetical protein